MKVKELMKASVETCRAGDSLARAAQIMWEHDCGAVPVVDDDEKVVGILTDRDACMAAYTQGRPLDQIPVSVAASSIVFAVRPDDALETAEDLMRRMQVRRLPVVDGGGRVKGMLSLGDLAAHAHHAGRRANGLSHDSLARTLAAVSRPRTEGEVPHGQA